MPNVKLPDGKVVSFPDTMSEQQIGEAMSTMDISGAQPKPSPKEKAARSQKAATAVRYGVPIAAGAALPYTLAGAAIGGGISALSELTASHLEKISSDPQIDSHWKDIKSAGLVGGLDIALYGLERAARVPLRGLARKILLPKTLPREIEIAQGVLGKIQDKTTRTKWQKFRGKSQPFSLTLGQLNKEEVGFFTQLEAVARSGMFGSKTMSRFDARNEKHVADALDKYILSRSTEMTGPEFGRFMQTVLGTSGKPGELFKPVEAYRSYLYRQFDQALELNATKTLDLSELKKVISSSTDRDILSVYEELRRLKLLPPMKATTKKNLIVGASGREINVGGQDAGWKSVPAGHVSDALRVINSKWTKADDKFNGKLGLLKAKVEPVFDKFVDSVPDLKALRKTANSYYGQKEDFLYNEVLKSVRRAITRKPSGVLSMFDMSSGNAAATYDNLMTFKKGLYFSAATPPSAKIGKALDDRVEVSFLSGGGKAAIEKQYQEGVVKPLRHQFIVAATERGALNPTKLLNRIEKIEGTTPELLHEIWGSSAHVENIKRFATTLEVLRNKPGMESIFIQLAQAGAIYGTFQLSSYMGDDAKIATEVGGTTAILLGPRMLAKVFSNAQLTRNLTDGVAKGLRSPKLSMVLRKISAMKVGTEFWEGTPSTDEIQTYATMPTND